MPRIHIVALPHTLLTKDYDWCAYTAKVRRFVAMLAGRHDVLVYGPDVHDCPTANDYVPVVTEADRVKWFGRAEWDALKVFDRWDTNDRCWQITNARASEAIRERWQPGDLLGIIAGLCQQQIVEQLADLKPLVVEWGIGYSGVLDGSVKVYESYAWMHHVAGLRHADDIAFFDAVIPNCFDPDDLTVSAVPGDYLLYMGRPTARKGLPIIVDMLERIDVPLIVAGQPGHELHQRPGVHYAGLVTGKEKADLLAGALAVLTPSMYLEPYGGVAVEAMLSGTPVIATDWGAFTETVVQGVTGYRCRMLADFVNAVDQVRVLDRGRIHGHAVARYTTQVGAGLYDDYLNRVSELHGDGWYAPSSSAFRAWH